MIRRLATWWFWMPRAHHRPPLAAMTAVTGVLDRAHAELTGDAARAAQLVSDEIRNLTRLADDLIEISRFDAGTAMLLLDEVDLTAAVETTLRSRGWRENLTTTVLAGANGRHGR